MKAADTKLQFLQHIIFISAVFSSYLKNVPVILSVYMCSFVDRVFC